MSSSMKAVLFAAAMASSSGWSRAAEPSAPAAAVPAAPAEAHRPLWYRLFPRAFARELIDEGTRAVSLPIDDYQLGPIRTGDTVDVLVAFDARANKSKQRLAATVLQNMKVLGVERSGSSKEKGVLRIRANPNEVQYAALAASQGEVSIALRRSGDVDLYPMEMASFVKLFR